MRCCDTTGKRCYAGPRDAKRAARTMPNRIRIYVCRFCHSFHITSKPIHKAGRP